MTPNETILSTSCIWDAAEHSAFTDLIRYGGQCLCCFRESNSHALGREGILRVIVSHDGAEWTSASEIALPGFDLRDPHFSVIPDGRLMLVCGGRVARDGQYVHLQSFVGFSTDGRTWTPLVPSGPAQHWIWKVLWSEDFAYSWVREQNLSGIERPQPFRLLRSRDAITWEVIAEATSGNEAVTLVRSDGRMFVLLRALNSVIGESAPPYTDWTWSRTGYFIGGPAWIQLTDGRVMAGGRLLREPSSESKSRERLMMLHHADLATKTLHPILELPSQGDCSYPGFVEYEDELWTSYYSEHGGKCAIYLTRIPLAALDGDLSGQFPPCHEQGPLLDLDGINLAEQRLHPSRLR